MTTFPRVFSIFYVLIAAAILGSAAAAQAQVAARALEAIIARSPQVRAHVLHVKLREGSGAELVDGRLRSRTGVALGPLQDLLERALLDPSEAVTAVFTLPWDELDRLHRVACENLPANNRPGHLGLWYRIELPTAAAAGVLAEQLWELELVEHVTREAIGAVASARPLTASPSLPTSQDIPPPTPDFRSLQQTHEPSPLGHGTWQAQGILGARGQGVRFLMVESEWNYGHEDVSGLVQANVIGPVPGSSSSEANHGTAGASMILADRNEYGITGIADECEPRFLSQLTNGGVANTLLLAGANAQSGDVVMLVMMFLLAQNGLQDWVPFELLQPVFDATLTLTGNGVLTVVSAGNGDNNLDDPRFFRRFDRTFRDSGAIMVTSSEAVALDKAPFSNYGSRIDANSWGDDVVACGIGTLFFPNNDRRQTYTADYTGTSSAVPSIAGMVLAMQGAAQRQLGQRLTLSQIRQMLWTHGPQSPDHIGRRPDLPAILTTLGIADGLRLSHPDVAIGGSETVTVTGPAGAGAFLFAAFDTGSTTLGFNRAIHLALGSILTVGFVPMPLGTAGFSIAIPNDPGFVGLSLYVQAGVLQGGNWHVTNSGQLSIW